MGHRLAGATRHEEETGIALINGTDAAETLPGTGEADTIEGRGGADSVLGLEGDDELSGGAGSDSLIGGPGDDILWGQGSFDGLADELLDGGDGDDFLFTGASGSNTVLGGDGADTLSAVGVLDGGAGNDDLHGGGNTVFGGDGDDMIAIARGGTLMSGGAGRDLFTVRTPDILLNPPGPGPDAVVTDFATGPLGDRIDLGPLLAGTSFNGLSDPFGPAGYLRLRQEGADTILELDSNGGGNSWQAMLRLQGVQASSLGSENLLFRGLLLEGTPAADSLTGTINADTILGFDGNDMLTGLAGDDLIEGGVGMDRLVGGAGNDTLLGGDGESDALYGGPGADSYDGGQGFDILHFLPGSGDPPPAQGVVASLLTGVVANDGYGNAEIMLGGVANTIEMLVGGTLADDLTGKRITSSLYGETRVAFLQGGGGADSIRAAPGDEYWVAVDMLGSGGPVVVNLSGQWAVDTSAPTLIDVLFNIGAARGSRYDDTLIGNDGDNFFRGEGGNDSISGGLGAHDLVSYLFSTNAVTVDLTGGTAVDGLPRFAPGSFTPIPGSVGTDTLSGIENVDGSAAGGDTLLGDGVANLLSGYGQADLIEGRDGDDRLRGGTGRDSLHGGQGNDTLVGGAGHDMLVGGEGADRLTGKGGRDLLSGGAGGDLFSFGNESVGDHDRILDFNAAEGDRIRLGGIDAIAGTPEDDAFVFLGAATFTGAAGELRAEALRRGDGQRIEGDVDGDGVADVTIDLATDAVAEAGWFIL